MEAKFNNHLLTVEENCDERAHIIPIDDLKPHIQRGDDYILIVHYSYDGREFFEEEEIKGH